MVNGSYRLRGETCSLDEQVKWMGRSCEFCFHPEGMEIMRNKVKRFTLSVVVAVSAACAPVAVVHADTKADLNIDRVISVEQERQTSTRSAFTEQANDAGKESERVSEEGIAFSLGENRGRLNYLQGLLLPKLSSQTKMGITGLPIPVPSIAIQMMELLHTPLFPKKSPQQSGNCSFPKM